MNGRQKCVNWSSKDILFCLFGEKNKRHFYFKPVEHMNLCEVESTKGITVQTLPMLSVHIFASK